MRYCVFQLKPVEKLEEFNEIRGGANSVIRYLRVIIGTLLGPVACKCTC